MDICLRFFLLKYVYVYLVLVVVSFLVSLVVSTSATWKTRLCNDLYVSSAIFNSSHVLTYFHDILMIDTLSWCHAVTETVAELWFLETVYCWYMVSRRIVVGKVKYGSLRMCIHWHWVMWCFCVQNRESFTPADCSTFYVVVTYAVRHDWPATHSWKPISTICHTVKRYVPVSLFWKCWCVCQYSDTGWMAWSSARPSIRCLLSHLYREMWYLCS